MFNPVIATFIAFCFSILLVVVKTFLWLLSGSSTVLASLSDSIQDSFLSATNFMAVRYAMKPADDDHRYGHGKMEGIAAMAQAAFIIGSCLYVILDAIRSVSNPQEIDHPWLVMGVMLGSIILNTILVIYQHHVLKRSGSLAVEADRAHYIGDAGIHFGVILAVCAGEFLGWRWADPLIAVMVAVWLMILARHIGQKAVDMLMDRELPNDERETIKTIIKRTRGVVHFHDLRTYRNGQMVMISMDIEVEPSLSFIDAHNISKRVEDRLHKSYPKSEIMIHVDPCGDITDSRHRKIKKHHVH